MANTQVQLDGRTLEGGGQIVRIAVGLSALTGIPVRITNIRGNRSDGGGLKTQHLASVDWLSQACNGKTRGATLKSTTLDFTPGSLKSGSPAYRLVKGRNDLNSFWECKLDIRTAGSTGLGLQAILPFIIFEPPRNEDGTLSNLPTQLTLSGGTNASNSPSYEYIAHVLLPTLHNIGLPKITSGLYERNVGNERGTFTLYIPARQQLDLPAFSLHPGTSTSKPQPPERFAVTFIAPDGSHTHLIDMLLPELKKYFGKSYSAADKNITYNFDYSLQGKRYYLLLVATVPSSSDDPTTPKTYKLGRDFMYTSKHAARRVTGDMSKRVCQELHAEWDSGAYVDEYMRDQLVVYQALAQGESRVYGGRTGHGEPRPASLHARTAEWVCEQMDNAD